MKHALHALILEQRAHGFRQLEAPLFQPGVHAEAVSIYTGDGCDTVNIINATVIDHLLAKLGAGNDTFLAANSTFTGQGIIDGGKGNDHVKFTKTKKPKGFRVDA